MLINKAFLDLNKMWKKDPNTEVWGLIKTAQPERVYDGE
jgi:hypothetical protein